MRTSKIFWVAVLSALVLMMTPSAFAALARVGPIVPYNAATHTGNGYPKFYLDQNGVAVDIQVPPFGDLVNAPTMIFAPPVAGNQFSLDIGFGSEIFFFTIQPDPKSTTFAPPIDGLDPLGGKLGKFNPLIGVEASFANLAGTPTVGQQYVFQRIRFNWLAAPDGFYVFKHPYGVENMFAIVGGGLKFTTDIPVAPIGQPPSDLFFTRALTGPIGPFLFQVNPPVQFTALTPPPPFFNKPEDWLGDGVTVATFTGSPLNPPFNAFRLEAWQDQNHTIPLNLWPIYTPPPAPPTGTTNVIETPLGVIAGHRYHPPITGLVELLLLD